MGKLSGILTKAFIETTEVGDLHLRSDPPIELGRVVDIHITEISPNPSQPRRYFSTEELTGLAKSISQNGIVQPLTVRRGGEGFELISGERRLRAAKLAGLRSAPCIVIDADSVRSAVLALVENLQRSDLNCFEEANAIAALLESGELSREEVSLRLGLARSTVANKLRLLKLTDAEQKMICANGLTERHARALLKVEQTELRLDILNKMIQGHWTVEATEKYIARLEREKARADSYRKRSVMLKDIRLFFNSVNKALDVIRMAGVEADAERIDHEDHIEYIIRIPSSQETREEETAREE